MKLVDVSYAKVLVDTTFFPLINRWVCFTLDSVVYDVYVKESNVQHQHSVAVEDDFLPKGNQVQNPTGSGEENKGFECNGFDMEDETMHDRMERDFDDGEQKLVQTMLHNNQDFENMKYCRTDFRWDT